MYESALANFFGNSVMSLNAITVLPEPLGPVKTSGRMAGVYRIILYYCSVASIDYFHNPTFGNCLMDRPTSAQLQPGRQPLTEPSAQQNQYQFAKEGSLAGSKKLSKRPTASRLTPANMLHDQERLYS